MTKLTIVLLVAALAYTSGKAVDDYNQNLGSPDLPGFPPGFPKFDVPTSAEIEKLKPRNPNEHVAGTFQSSHSFKKIVNGQVVTDEQDAESVVNQDGYVKKDTYNNNSN